MLFKQFWLVQSYNQIKNLTCNSPCYQFNESACWLLSFFRVENLNPIDIRTQQLIGYHQFDLQSILFLDLYKFNMAIIWIRSNGCDCFKEGMWIFLYLYLWKINDIVLCNHWLCISHYVYGQHFINIPVYTCTICSFWSKIFGHLLHGFFVLVFLLFYVCFVLF
jgi:hypothetical protein